MRRMVVRETLSPSDRQFYVVADTVQIVVITSFLPLVFLLSFNTFNIQSSSDFCPISLPKTFPRESARIFELHDQDEIKLQPAE
jgi:hypothetical protein